jgi:hypothetical protein
MGGGVRARQECTQNAYANLGVYATEMCVDLVAPSLVESIVWLRHGDQRTQDARANIRMYAMDKGVDSVD